MDEDGQLDDLSRRLGEARRRGGGGTGPRAAESGAGVAMRIGVELVAALAVGAALGWFLDRWLGTAPWLMVVLFALGAAAGVMNVHRYMTGMDGAPGWRRGGTPGRPGDGDDGN